MTANRDAHITNYLYLYCLPIAKPPDLFMHASLSRIISKESLNLKSYITTYISGVVRLTGTE